MLGFISKEDKKILQKVRENKEKDVEIWKYLIRRESAIWVLSSLFSGCLLSDLIDGNIVLWEDKFLVVIGLIFAVICFIFSWMVQIELLREDKKEGKKKYNENVKRGSKNLN